MLSLDKFSRNISGCKIDLFESDRVKPLGRKYRVGSLQ